MTIGLGRKTAWTTFAVAVALSAATDANADIVLTSDVSLFGSGSGVGGSIAHLFADGHLNITLDDTVLDSWPSDRAGFYEGSLTNFSLTSDAVDLDVLGGYTNVLNEFSIFPIERTILASSLDSSFSFSGLDGTDLEFVGFSIILTGQSGENAIADDTMMAGAHDTVNNGGYIDQFLSLQFENSVTNEEGTIFLELSNLQATIVPVPGTLALLGGVGLFAGRRRRC